MPNGTEARVVGIELYFDNLQGAKDFYLRKLGLELLDEQVGHHARLNAGEIFVCLERKGAESYPSRDKAVVFLEVSNLAGTIRRIGEDKILQMQPPSEDRTAWAVLHDPEGYNIVLLEALPAASRINTKA